ncbi:hypothetical protein FACS189419_09340 [Planctomycetales bacterium]|nr:hypothetical protein FACS189419_09340 [Planctomycetales bacterium]
MPNYFYTDENGQKRCPVNDSQLNLSKVLAMFLRSFLFVFVLFVFFALTANAAEMRKWTSTSGKTYEREFVKLEGDKVFWKDADGKVKNIELEKLSKEDRKYVEKQTGKKEKESEPTVIESSGKLPPGIKLD